jgi:hypothetical protein
MFRSLMVLALYSYSVHPMDLDFPQSFRMQIENCLDCVLRVKINDTNATYVLDKIFEPQNTLILI